jgi:hypothetical protein
MNLAFLPAIARLPELPSTHSAIGRDIQRKPESSGRSLAFGENPSRSKQERDDHLLSARVHD